jgi:DNA-binding MurR/RpiR family transcriptional regulator
MNETDGSGQRLALARRLGEVWESFPAGQRRVADFLMEHADEAAFFNVREVARRSGTSTATVVRFAQTLGYAGYQELMEELQRNLTSRLGPAGRFEATLADFDGQGESHDANPLATAIQRDIENLRASLELVDDTDFAEAVSILGAARIVYLLGRGLARAPIEILAQRLPRLGIPVVVLDEPAPSLYNAILPLATEDCLVVSSFRTPNPPDVVRAAQFARSRGAPVLALTDHPVAPVARLATVSLFARRGPVNQMASMAAPVSLAGALAISLAMTRHEEAAAAYAAYEELIAAEDGIQPGLPVDNRRHPEADIPGEPL